MEFGKPVTRPLKYIAAADVLPVLVQALTEPGDQNQQGGNLPGQQGEIKPARTRLPTKTRAPPVHHRHRK